MRVQLLSHVQFFATLWTVAHRAPPSMGFSRQEYWSGVPLPSPEFGTNSINYVFNYYAFSGAAFLSWVVIS